MLVMVQVSEKGFEAARGADDSAECAGKNSMCNARECLVDQLEIVRTLQADRLLNKPHLLWLQMQKEAIWWCLARTYVKISLRISAGRLRRLGAVEMFAIALSIGRVVLREWNSCEENSRKALVETESLRLITGEAEEQAAEEQAALNRSGCLPVRDRPCEFVTAPEIGSQSYFGHVMSS